MEARFISINDANALDEWFKRSHEQPVILFKHSTTCPISSAAYQEVENLAAEVGLIVVQRARDVSNEVEMRTGLRHESPQALVLRNGEVVWSASHWNVTADAVNRAVQAVQS